LNDYKRLLSGDVGTVKVRSVEEIGNAKVYDISVKNHERFFGGFYPVLLHNSGHKMLGPTGIGVLYMREELEGKIEPQSIGGGGIKEVSQEQYKLAESPGRFESGTPPIAEAIGLGVAAEYLRREGLEKIAAHERELTNRIFKGLQATNRVEVYGPTNSDHRTGIVSFNIAQVNPHDVALALDISGNIMVRSGYHCCIPLVKDVLGQGEGTVRASVYLYNTVEEVDKLIELIDEIARTARN
jgi:cysteine desulfurase/selenocysteine lyase